MWCNGQVYLKPRGMSFKPGQLAIERRQPRDEAL